jgi:hypothetical protein
MRADQTGWQQSPIGLGSRRLVGTMLWLVRSGVVTGSFATQGAIQTSCLPKASL